MYLSIYAIFKYFFKLYEVAEQRNQWKPGVYLYLLAFFNFPDTLL